MRLLARFLLRFFQKADVPRTPCRRWSGGKDGDMRGPPLKRLPPCPLAKLLKMALGTCGMNVVAKDSRFRLTSRMIFSAMRRKSSNILIIPARGQMDVPLVKFCVAFSKATVSPYPLPQMERREGWGCTGAAFEKASPVPPCETLGIFPQKKVSGKNNRKKIGRSAERSNKTV